MSSLNGDVTIFRNGRSTSQVSIYNYPEHLNPFYEEDNHKRLRFWKFGKNNDVTGRRNSFSIGGLADWSFKSFRLKKKSSTLGINKTSESPPVIRREIIYDPKSRHTVNNDAPVLNGNFMRSSLLRNSIQTLSYPQKLSDENYNGFGLNRNDRYRNTMQTGGTLDTHKKKQSAPHRYIYGGSTTPQPLRNKEFGRNESLGVISRGSSQNSVYSTNPFESDIDQNDISGETQNEGSSIPRKLKRKKRRAPAPPLSIDRQHETASKTDVNSNQIGNLKDEQNNNSLTILELTAEIKNFVNSSKADKLEDQPKVVLPDEKIKKTVTKDIHETGIVQQKPQYSDTSGSNAINVPQKQYKNDEIGRIECIHIHLDTPNPLSKKSECNKVSSFKQISSITPFTVDRSKNIGETETKLCNETEKNLNKSKISEMENPTISNLLTKANVKKNNTDIIENISNDIVGTAKNYMKDTHPDFVEHKNNLKSFKPQLAAKPINIANTKIAPVSLLSASTLEGKESRLELASSEDLKIYEKPQQGETIEMPNELKIFELEKNAADSQKSLNCFGVHDETVDKKQKFTLDLMYRPKPSSHLEWKKSTLAPLETNLPPEKRKSVKDIIESINRSQKLLGASSNIDQTCYSYNTKTNDSKTTFEALEQTSQAQYCDSKNDLDQNFKSLDESKKEIQLLFKKIAIIDNLGEEKISNTSCTLNTFDIEIPKTMNNETLNNEMFQKSKISKDSYNDRESSPTALNLDWNPVPKPKRAVNIDSSDLQ